MKSHVSWLFALLFFFGCNAVFAQAENSARHDARLQWWRDARFGMFIHWGLYAIPAGEWNGKTGYGEWIRTSAEIPLEIYDRFQPGFNPVDFNADEWVRMAKDAGMKYIVITSKHHDGFCLFDTKQTGFNVMKSPFQRDPMKDLAAACKKYGLKFCFYYSIMDWHHPDYLPRREWERDRSAEGADFGRYVEYMKAELKELLTNYGEIGVLWFDGEWESTWNEKYGKEIYQYVRSLQPDILVNNRVGAGRLDMEGMTKQGAFGGDFGTPEQQIPPTGLPGVDWETCMTMNDHWGYNSHDKNFKSTKEMLQMLSDIASKGGNYLLNVGPTALGRFPQESIDRLKAIGQWMKVNGEAIYGTKPSPFSSLDWGRCTQKSSAAGAILYLHVLNWPANGKLTISGVLNSPITAYLLADPKKTPLQVIRQQDALIITLPKNAPDPDNSIVKLELQGKLDQTDPPLIEAGFDQFVDSLIVELKSSREKVEIRYTLDRNTPDLKSPLYKKPVTLKSSTMIAARCFRNGKPVSSVIKKEFKKVKPLPAYNPFSGAIAEKQQEDAVAIVTLNAPPPAGSVNAVTVPADAGEKRPASGLKYQYFEGKFEKMPDFSLLQVRADGVVDYFQFDPRIQNDLFAFVYTGYILVPETNVYEFYTSSDDGSMLYIDDQKIVSNDGLHGLKEESGIIPLSKGYHKIRVEFFECTGSENLVVFIKSPAFPKQMLPKEWLFNN